MKFYSSVFLLLVLWGCKSSVSTKNSQSESAGIKNNATVTVQKTGKEPAKPLLANEEFIRRDSVRINGELPIITKTKALFRLIGTPDSIVDPDMNDICVSYYSKAFRCAYLNNTRIEVYGDTAVVTSINFRSDSTLSLKTPKCILNKNTSLESIKKYFPKAVKNKYKLNVHNIGETIAVNLPISKELSDHSWILFFINGKLIRIDYYMPC